MSTLYGLTLPALNGLDEAATARVAKGDYQKGLSRHLLEGISGGARVLEYGTQFGLIGALAAAQFALRHATIASSDPEAIANAAALCAANGLFQVETRQIGGNPTDLPTLLADLRPSAILLNLGFESGAGLGDCDLAPVDLAVVELAPHRTAPHEIAAIFNALHAANLYYSPAQSKGNQVVFRRNR